MGPRCGVAHRSKAGVLRCEELWRTSPSKPSNSRLLPEEHIPLRKRLPGVSGKPERRVHSGCGHDLAFRACTRARQVLRAPLLSDPAGARVIGVIGLSAATFRSPIRNYWSYWLTSAARSGN